MASYASTLKKADHYYGDFSGSKLFGVHYQPHSTKKHRNHGQNPNNDVEAIASCRMQFASEVFQDNALALSGSLDEGPSIFERAVEGVKQVFFGPDLAMEPKAPAYKFTA